MLAAPEVADRVAVLAVPLGPQRGEAADVVAALADVPGLGDELDLADDRVLLHEVEERRQPVDLVELAGQRAGQVEAEAVDVHLGDPVAQRVHDQLQHVRVLHEQRVAGAGGVVVVLRVVVDEPVVGGVVDAAERQRRAHLVALGGVVVDHVEDDLDALGVQRLHHRLELLHLLAARAAGGVVVVRGEEADGVVAPVVPHAAVGQVAVVDELVHRHELDGGDAELLVVLDHHRVRQRRVGAADLLGDARVGLGEALDVRLVDDRLVVRGARVAVVVPVEVRADDDRLAHVRAGVLLVVGVLVAPGVGEAGLRPVDVAVDGLGVGVEQQLVRVAAVAVLRLVRPVHPEAVALARADVRQVAVPDEGVALGQGDPGLGAVLVEQAQLDLGRDLGEQREVGAGAVVGGAERVRRAGPDAGGAHACASAAVPSASA